jgi:hypothetical protein
VRDQRRAVELLEPLGGALEDAQVERASALGLIGVSLRRRPRRRGGSRSGPPRS